MEDSKIMVKRIFIVFIGILLFGSCVSKKRIVYFQKDEINQSKVTNGYVTIFKPDDLLTISVSAEDLKSAMPFNLPVVNFGTTGGVMGQPQQVAYLIDNQGFIDFPILGKIKLGGKSRAEGIDYLKSKLDPDYVKNPTINIQISNFKISVLGDVRRPGVYTVVNERITILEALALAGDLNISGQRENIRVQREEGNKKVFYNVNLLSKDIFTSPVYYLQQNDVVYVEPNYATSQSASSNTNTSLFISISGLLITIVSLLLR